MTWWGCIFVLGAISLAVFSGSQRSRSHTAQWSHCHFLVQCWGFALQEWGPMPPHLLYFTPHQHLSESIHLSKSLSPTYISAICAEDTPYCDHTLGPTDWLKSALTTSSREKPCDNSSTLWRLQEASHLLKASLEAARRRRRWKALRKPGLRCSTRPGGYGEAWQVLENPTAYPTMDLNWTTTCPTTLQKLSISSRLLKRVSHQKKINYPIKKN